MRRRAVVLGRAADEGRRQAPGEADEEEGEDEVYCGGLGRGGHLPRLVFWVKLEAWMLAVDG